MKHILLICFILTCVGLSAQQGTKANWTTKKPVTVESLTKDAIIYDHFVDGGTVYLSLKKDKQGKDIYFIITKNSKGNLCRKRIYINETVTNSN